MPPAEKILRCFQCTGDWPRREPSLCRRGAWCSLTRKMTLDSGLLIEENHPLAPLTTLGIGGPARWYTRLTSESQLVDAFTWARERHLPVFVLGGGSNLVVADSGFDGLVVQPALRGIARSYRADLCLFRAAAGELWDNFVAETIAANCSGIECLAGIPGTVGGTPVQNVGAYGQEVAETIRRVRVLDRESLQFHEMEAPECGFAYRRSIFNSTVRNRFVVTAVEFGLVPGGAPSLRYADLQRTFAAQPQPTLAAVADAVRSIRRGKGMLLVPGDPDARSAGSFFRNPVISAAEFDALAKRLGAPPPCYPSTADSVKLPAAWLIEQAGFARGFRQGNVGISSRHTLALIHYGGGTAAELLALRDRIAFAVRDRFGIDLEMEPVLLGF